MNSKIIIICAQQRSGTTALQRTLGGTGIIEDCGEIFHNGEHEITKPSNFYFFLSEKGFQKELLSGNVDDRIRVIGLYFDYLESLSNKKYCLIDIKYNSWDVVTSPWANRFNDPIIMEVAKRRGIPLLHMIRLDVFSQAFSLFYARESGKWHFHGDENADEIRFRLPAQKFKDAIEEIDFNVTQFRKYLNGYPKAVELIYERTYVGSHITEYGKSIIMHLIEEGDYGVLEKLYVPLKKSPIRPLDTIENVEEICKILRCTKYEPQLAHLFK